MSILLTIYVISCVYVSWNIKHCIYEHWRYWCKYRKDKIWPSLEEDKKDIILICAMIFAPVYNTCLVGLSIYFDYIEPYLYNKRMNRGVK